MRIEFIPKQQAKIMSIEPLSAKRGQTDTVPAVAVTLRLSLPTSKLAMLDPALDAFLFQEGERAQGQMEPTKVLTAAAKALGALGWSEEQTGVKLNVYYGISGDLDQKLKDGEISKVKLTPKDGGWDLDLRYYTEKDVDEDVLGCLGVLKNHDVDVEVIPAAIVDQQPDLVEQAGKKGAQTPEQALAAHLGQTAH